MPENNLPMGDGLAIGRTLPSNTLLVISLAVGRPGPRMDARATFCYDQKQVKRRGDKALVAQSAERAAVNRKVVGSIPT